MCLCGDRYKCEETLEKLQYCVIDWESLNQERRRESWTTPSSKGGTFVRYGSSSGRDSLYKYNFLTLLICEYTGMKEVKKKPYTDYFPGLVVLRQSTISQMTTLNDN